MLNLYTETAFEAAPPTPASRVVLTIPRSNGSYDRSKNSNKEKSRQSAVTDEKSYANEFLASASAIYFRESRTYPRSFQWRIVSSEQTLEVKCADFARSAADPKEAYLTLALEFQDKISPRGVTFADADTTSVIHVYVLTKTNEVFEIRLSTDYLRDASSIPQNVSAWCSPVAASSLSIDTAYRIHATTPTEIFVSFVSGRVQHWKRDTIEDQWKLNNYDERTWGASLLSIVGRKGNPDIDFEGLRLAYNTAHAFTASSSHLYTLCLNHTLKVWNLQNGLLVDSRDLLDVAREPQERIQLNPSEPGYIQLLQLSGSTQQILATYSPHQGGQFKFWRIHSDAESHSLEDMFSSAVLTPPDPDPTGNTVWALAGIEAAFDRNTKDWLLWVLWRNNNYHQLYTLNFNFPNLQDSWQQNWTHSTKSGREKAPDLTMVDNQDITSKWLNYLFFPGRYSDAVLEAALSQYRTLTDTKISSSFRSRPLVERLTSVIASEVSLRKYHDSDMDFERFNADTDQQWRNFWRIAETMNEGRLAPLSLSYDTYTDTTWISMADMCSLVREASDLEILRLNGPRELQYLQTITRERWPHRKINNDSQSSEDAACLLYGTDTFVRSFSPELMADLIGAIDEDLYTDCEIAVPERIINIYNEIDLANAISPEAEAEFEKILSPIGGSTGIRTEMLDVILSSLSAAKWKHTDSKLIKTVFGSELTSSAILEEIVNLRQMLLNLLVLTLFVDESDSFHASRFFEEIIGRLRIVERNLWLATHYRRVLFELKVSSKAARMKDQESPDSTNTRAVSIMDDLFGDVVPPQPAVNVPLAYLVTTHIAQNLDFISGDNQITSEDAAVRLQCNLIKSGDSRLALEFERFQPTSSWSLYVKGRLRLALAQYEEAAIYFRKASYGMANGKAVGRLQEMSDGLLSLVDAQCFNNGTMRYYQHIVTLFDKEKAFSQTAEFARLALRSQMLAEKEPDLRSRQDLLSRLFTAELECSRFESAYEALIQFPDQALQKTSANTLVNAMLDPNLSLTNGAGLLRSLQKLPWSSQPQLANQLDTQLASLAQKQTTLPGQWASNNLTVDYLSILHALRLSRRDYRGAVTVLFDRLKIVQRSGRARHDPQATALRHALLALINTMTCVDPDEAYILVDVEDDPRNQGVKKRSRGLELNNNNNNSEGGPRKRRRVIVTLDDLRREYQSVLDRCNRIERGDFDFDINEDDDESEEDGEGDQNSRQVVHLNGDSMQM